MNKREIEIVEFVNRNHDLKKRNAARRARCFKRRLEDAFVAAVKLVICVGTLMLLFSCFIIDSAEPIPWGLITAGAIIAIINYIIYINID